MPDRGQFPVITASEVAQHAYCARAWWLSRVKGYPSAHVAQLAAGQEAHRAHGQQVLSAQRLQVLACLLLVVAAGAAAIGLYLWKWGG